MARHLKTIALIVVCCFTLSLAGCSTLGQSAKEHPTATGAAAGGVLGGAIGATAGGLIGGDTKSAIIGGLAGAAVGAITGAMIGKYMAKKTKSAEQTAKEEGYATTGASTGTTKAAAATTSTSTASGTAKVTQAAAPPTKPAGTVVKLKAIEIEPSQVAPGETVKINFIYALLTPDPNAKTTVEESRAVHFRGEEIGTVTFAKEHTAGTWKTTVPIAMPSQAEAGTYVVTGNLKAGPQQTTESTTFMVKPKM